MKDNKNSQDRSKEKPKEKEIPEQKSSVKEDSPYMKLAIALEKICADDFDIANEDIDLNE
ncbi:hypothetical protein [Prevotella sp. 10(H)]|uniref:hypothetical protein n=1 Tax=Prevotella sp. 10(H) TaxID=1158294 RepID=UPI0004A6C86B|nr:hypothetical protein [Prevotella sp. 10(H)]